MRVCGSADHDQPVASGDTVTSERSALTASRDVVTVAGPALDPELPQPASSAAASAVEDAIATMRTTRTIARRLLRCHPARPESQHPRDRGEGGGVVLLVRR